jgi:PTS system nitrogen regulatory IIA component
LPAQRVGGEWRFSRTEINQWLESQLASYDDSQLAALQRSGSSGPVLGSLLARESVAVPLKAGTRASALRELLALAEATWQVYDPEAVYEAIRNREEQATTALPNGVAIPHPHRPLPAALGESVVAFGRTSSGIPFGAPDGSLTDLFFLVACRDDRTHLDVLTRLMRLLMRDGFLDQLRAAPSAEEVHELIVRGELELLGG